MLSKNNQSFEFLCCFKHKSWICPEWCDITFIATVEENWSFAIPILNYTIVKQDRNRIVRENEKPQEAQKYNCESKKLFGNLAI